MNMQAETKDELPVVAHRIYIAAEQRQEFVQDLDDAVDDLTNCECEVEDLTSHAAAHKLIDQLNQMIGMQHTQLAAAQSRINALLELYEAVSVHLGSADCDCPYRKREAGEHLSHCHLSDLNYAFERASPSAGRGEVSNG